MEQRRRRFAALVIALPLVLSAACTIRIEGQSSAGSATPSSPATPRTKGPAPAPNWPTPPAHNDEQLPDSTQFPADTGDKHGDAQAGASPDEPGHMQLSGIRITSQDGFTRLVIGLNGHGVPAWTATYGAATGPGGGPVSIQGDAFLRVSLETGADADHAGQGQNDVKLSPGPVAEARTTGFFEGTEEVLIGMRGGEAPFRAFALTDPGRIVIDVRPAG